MASSSVGVPTRPFGRTGIPVSILALGGWHLGLPKTERESTRLVHAAIDGGITFMDNAWDYNEGVSETRMGKALVGRRDKVFLMTKVCAHGRDARTAMRQLEDSLRRLKTDYLDLWQIHEVIFDDEPAKYFAKGGAVEALDKARQQGKVRFVGFTGHKDPDLHLADAGARLPVGRLPAAAQLLRRVVSQLRAARAAGVESPRDRRDRHEEPWRRRPVGEGKAVTPQEAHPLRAEPADRHPGQRHRHDARASAEPGHRAGLPSDDRPAQRQALLRRVAAKAADGRFELYKISAAFDGNESRRQHGLPLMDALTA